MWLPAKAAAQDRTETDQDSKKCQPKEVARQVMNECDLSNLVSVYTTKRIPREHEMMDCITV